MSDSGAADNGRPLCSCHGEAMKWNRDARDKAGGYWACRVKHREANARYYAAHRQKLLAKQKEYARVHPERRRATLRKYYEANAEELKYATTRRRLRARIEWKRQRIAELEALLSEA